MTAPATPHTALVEVRGEIAAEAEASAEALVGALQRAFEDAGAQAVVLRINSPGGSPVQSGIINDEIRRLKALHKKKVYAVVEEVCASGAYYVAVAADEIYVDKASIVGSIGVLMDGFGFTGLMDKLGVERRLITAGSNKGMLDPFTAQDPKQRAYAQAMIDQIHQQFIDVVKQGRGDRLKETPETFSGLFWNGEEAVSPGPGRQPGQPRLRGARGDQGRGDHRLHPARQRGRAPGQALRRRRRRGRGQGPAPDGAAAVTAPASGHDAGHDALTVPLRAWPSAQYLLPKQALTWPLAGPSRATLVARSPPA